MTEVGVACRLQGGPYDGDEGHIIGPPRTIWAVDCPGTTPCTPDDCKHNGVHWYGDPSSEQLRHVMMLRDERGLRLERYKKDVEKSGVRIYVWADMRGRPRISGREKRRKREPVAA